MQTEITKNLLLDTPDLTESELRVLANLISQPIFIKYINSVVRSQLTILALTTLEETLEPNYLYKLAFAKGILSSCNTFTQVAVEYLNQQANKGD